MEIVFSESVPVTDSSSVGEVRRAALAAAHRLGFDETRAGELALLATEASRNALIHGGGGQVVIGGMGEQGNARATILAMDKGTGIPNVAQAMSDGYSTAGTMGGGLGAMKRIATALEIFTGSTGTIVLLELGEPAPANQPRVAGLTLPYPGERLCGDGWYCHFTPGRTMVLVVDGLGHGWGASEAAQEAIATFRKHVRLSPVQILECIHDALRKTRGAVAAVAEISPAEQTIVYAGVGNISGVLLWPGRSQNLVSHSGTLGSRITRIQDFRAPWSPDTILILHSDGLNSRWDLSSYAGLLARHPAVIGGALLRDFRRAHDDAGVVVVKAA